jgi:mono/diheme cytochrome c family protein
LRDPGSAGFAIQKKTFKRRVWLMSRFLFMAVLVFGLVISGSALFAAGDAGAGKAVFAKKCQVCHGASGEGNQGMAKALKVEIMHLGSAQVQKKSDAEIKNDIVKGVGKMKPVTGLNDGDIDNVIAFVRTLKQ